MTSSVAIAGHWGRLCSTMRISWCGRRSTAPASPSVSEKEQAAPYVAKEECGARDMEDWTRLFPGFFLYYPDSPSN